MKTSRFRTWLNNIPIEDPINRQMAALLQVILIGLVVIIGLSTIANLFLVPPDFPRSEIVIQSLLILLTFVTPVILLRRGYFRISVIIIIAIFMVLVSASIFESNLRAKAESLAFFTIGILLAGLLVGRTAMIITFTISAGVVLFFAFNEQDPTLMLDYIAVAGNFILLNGLLAIFINSFGIALRNALRASLQREEDLKVEIAQRKQAEEKVNALNEQLQKQVAELERFTYTVSHDLRSPLVTIKGFLGMLNRDLHEDRPDKVQNDFQRIAGATEKMDALLKDLLELSRIGRIVNPPIEIDSVRLIQDALENVDAQLRSKNVIMNVAPDLPTIYGDRIRLREVFENLIDNAVKYTGEQTEPIIEIGVKEQANETVFYVRDNGMGIDPQYHARIFNLFEKLDPTMEGTGIGLALVKRIIEIHGGRIWVESELGKGTTFFFTIPGEGKSTQVNR
jgi:signal transduction histidine kinase